MRREWTRSETALLKAVYSHRTNKELQHIFNRSIVSIQKKASKLGIHKTPQLISNTRAAYHKAKRMCPDNLGKARRPRKKYYVTKPDGTRILEHRYVMEEYLGRKLFNTEVVHHKNGDATDNSIDNLMIMEHGQHTAYHHTGLKRTMQARENISAAAKMRRKACNESATITHEKAGYLQ